MGGRAENTFAQEGDRLRLGRLCGARRCELKVQGGPSLPRRSTAPFTTPTPKPRSLSLCTMTRSVSRTCSSEKSFLRVTRSAPPVWRERRKRSWKLRGRAWSRRARQLADIDAQFAEMQVKAPTDSILEVLSVKVGDVLAANREVATLILPQHLWVRVFVPEPWLGLIKVGDPGSASAGFVSRKGLRRHR